MKTKLIVFLMLVFSTSPFIERAAAQGEEDISDQKKCDVRIVSNGSGFSLSAEGSSGLHLRKPGNGDNKYYLYTNRKYIEFSIEADTTLEIPLSKDGYKVFYKDVNSVLALKEDAYSQANTIHNIKRNRYTLVKLPKLAVNESIELSVGDMKIKVNTSSGSMFKSVYGEVQYVTSDKDGNRSVKSKKFTAFSQKENLLYISDTLKLNKKDSIQSIYFNRGVRTLLTNLMIDDKPLNNIEYKVRDEKRNADDIVFEKAVISATSFSLEAKSYEIVAVCQSLADDGLEEVRFIIPVVVTDDGFVWSLNNILNVLFLVAVVALIGFGVRSLLKKRQKKNPKKIDDTPEPIIPSGPETDGEAGGQPGSQVNDEPTDSSTDDSFGGLSYKEIVNILVDYLGIAEKPNISLADGKLKNKLNKKAERSLCERWNKTGYADVKVAEPELTMDNLLTIIEKGYIGVAAKEALIHQAESHRIPIDWTNGSTLIDNLVNTLVEKGKRAGREGNKTAGYEEGKAAGLGESKAFYEPELDKLNNKIEQVTQQLKNAERELEDYKKEHVDPNHELRDKISDLNSQIAQLTQDKGKIEEKSAQLQNDLDDVKSQLTTSQANELQLSAKLKTAEQSETEAKSKLVLAEEQKTAMQQNVADWKSKSEQYESERDTHKHNADAKQQEIDRLKKEYQAKIAQLKSDSASKEASLKESNSAEIEQLKSIKQTEIDNLNGTHHAKVEQLNATITEMGVSVNVPRNQLISQIHNNVSIIKQNLDILLAGVAQQDNVFLYKTLLTDRILTGFNEAEAAIQKKVNNEWSTSDTNINKVKSDLVELFAGEGMARSGWINISALLSAYARIPALAERLIAQGLNTVALSRMQAAIVNMLGAVDITIFVPNLLAEEFNIAAFDSVNGDTRIDKLSADIQPRDYKGKVFDLIQVGYSVGTEMTTKPRVKYF